MKTTQREDHHEKLKSFIKEFEDQFDVELDSTGYEMTAKENGGVHEEEFWVNGLIESNVDQLKIDVGGWFSMDIRGEESDEVTVYCRLAVQVDGEDLYDGQPMAIQSRYHPDEEKWGELRWDLF